MFLFVSTPYHLSFHYLSYLNGMNQTYMTSCKIQCKFSGPKEAIYSLALTHRIKIIQKSQLKITSHSAFIFVEYHSVASGGWAVKMGSMNFKRCVRSIYSISCTLQFWTMTSSLRLHKL